MHGSCMCGAVQFDAEPVEMAAHACHCTMCRRWSGTALVAVPVDPDGLRWQGAENIRSLRSSDWAERAWCGACGTNLYYRQLAPGREHGRYHLSLGLFDDPDAFELTSEIFIDRKPASFTYAGERKRLTAAQVLAMYSGGET